MEPPEYIGLEPGTVVTNEQRFQRALEIALTRAELEKQRVHNRHGRVSVASLEDFGLIEPVDSDDGP